MAQMTEKWTEGLVRAPPGGQLQSSPESPPTFLPPPNTNTHLLTAGLNSRPPSPHLSITGLLPRGPAPSLSLPQKHRERRRSSAASNGFPGKANLPDLVQQSTSPLISPADALGAQVGGTNVGLAPPTHPHQSPPILPLMQHPTDPVTALPPPVHQPVTGSSIRG